MRSKHADLLTYRPDASCHPQPQNPFASLWPTSCRVPIVGFAAVSGTGKTTLAKAVIRILRDRGLRLAVIKKSHHDFEVDRVGKDSYELRHAGALQTVIGSPYRKALIVETPGAGEPTLDELIGLLDQSTLDLILVEGYKHDKLPKIELRRQGVDATPLAPGDRRVIAIARDDAPASELERTDVLLETIGTQPEGPLAADPNAKPWCLDLDRPLQVADFIHFVVMKRHGH